MAGRYYQLDSLRGLAALFVVFYHVYFVIGDMPEYVYQLLQYTPLRILISGTEAVIFFFILSGFVLSLPFYSNKQQQYVPFIIKRVIRIWVPYAVAISLAILAEVYLYNGPIQGLTSSFNAVWTSTMSPALVINHFLLIGTYDVYAYNFVLWSLIHELRISFLFPFLMYLIIRFGWKTNIAIGVGLVAIGAIAHLIYNNPYQPPYKSLWYILMFIVGALLAKHSSSLCAYYSKLKMGSRVFVFMAGLLVYGYTHLLKNPLLIDWGAMVGSSILLICGLASPVFAKILLLKPLVFLGKISYSLYLYHIIVIFSLLHLFYGDFPLAVILMMSVILSFVVSIVAWKYVELPSMSIGRKLAASFSQRRKPAQPEYPNIKKNF